MIQTCEHIHVNIRSYDPTRTTGLRNSFAREMRRRFNELIKIIRTSVVDNDCFGLQPTTFQMSPAQSKEFSFGRSQDKINGFMRWLQLQEDKGILETGEFAQVGQGIERAWTNKYIIDSYKRGVQRARYELEKAGFGVPSIDATGGIDISIATPFHLDRLGVLYTRTFNDLKGITKQMDTQISRILTQGIADGDNPRVLANKLVSTINGDGVDRLGLRTDLGRFIPARRRAEILARTEIVRAHHMATIQEYRNWAVEGVKVKAEWQTAGDDRVCSLCQDLQGQIFTLDEIQNKLPRHPQCRCVALPVLNE